MDIYLLIFIFFVSTKRKISFGLLFELLKNAILTFLKELDLLIFLQIKLREKLAKFEMSRKEITLRMVMPKIHF